MTNKKLYEAMGDIRDDYIVQAHKASYRSVWRKTIMAACLCVVTLAVGIWLYPKAAVPMPEPPIEDPTKTHTRQISIRLYDTIDECITNADIIFTCTVAEIGETYLYGNPTLPGGIHETSWPSIAEKFRTPVTLAVEEILLDNTATARETITVTEYCGTYDGYTVKSGFPTYEEGRRYLLFVAVAPDGKTHIVMHQGSVALSSADGQDLFVPLLNEKIYGGISSVEEVKAAVQKQQ